MPTAGKGVESVEGAKGEDRLTLGDTGQRKGRRMVTVKGVSGKLLTLEVELKECRNCHKPMLPSGVAGTWPFHRSNRKLLDEAVERHEIMVEAGLSEADVFGLCKVCVEAGGFTRECSLCNRATVFPSGFAFRLTDYEHGESYVDYVCRLCVDENARKLVDRLAEAGDIEDMRKGEA